MNTQTRKRNYYQNSGSKQKKRKQFTLEPGITGFLCTCNFHEKDCVRDAYKLLNEFADKIYGPDTIKISKTDEDEPKETGDSVGEATKDTEDDISTALSKEINELKAEYSKPVAARRFQAVDTGVKNVIFIRSSLSDPLELVTTIVKELETTKQQRTRYLLRLVPIDVVCKAYMTDIKQKAKVMLEKYFVQEPKTFSIVFNRYNNNSIQRDEIIQVLAEIVQEKNPGNKADLKNPELAVIVVMIRGVCLMSVAPNYYKFKKYNLLELCNTKETANTVKPESKEAKSNEEEGANKESNSNEDEEDTSKELKSKEEEEDANEELKSKEEEEDANEELKSKEEEEGTNKEMKSKDEEEDTNKEVKSKEEEEDTNEGSKLN